jgi:hypothetical protein
LKRHALNGKVHLKLRCAVWGTSGRDIGQQATSTTHECLNMPGFWYHDTHPILFTLVVDKFSVKYINEDDVKHLIASLKTMYKLKEHWTGD